MPPRPQDLQARARSVRRVLAYARSHPQAILGLAPEGGEPAGDRPLITLPAGDLAPGSRVTVALRPERLPLVPAGTENALPGTVQEAVFLGAITRVWVRTPAGVLLVELHALEGGDLKPGTPVHLAVQGEAAAVFPG